MKLINPSYEILYPKKESFKNFLKRIELAARTCYKSEDKISDDDSSAKNLCKTLLDRGHDAMLEFGDITVKFIADRGFTHELVRMRICSFAQESTRFCDYSKNKFGNQLTFIIPSFSDIKEGEYQRDIMSSYENFDNLSEIDKFLLLDYDNTESYYLLMIKNGATAQEARSILPIGIKTEIVCKTNIREWRHIFKLRTSNKAHPEMQRLMRPLLDELKKLVPLLFDDIKY